MKIAIYGGAKTGKTTFSERFKDAYHTDDLIGLGWSELSEKASYWFDKEDFCIEGVAVGRALRKWMKRNNGKPCDTLYWMNTPFIELTPEQKNMNKGCETIFNEIKGELIKRGVQII